jgi:hypothetical protein
MHNKREHSGTEKLLKGRVIPALGVSRPVREIIKKDGSRVVIDAAGNKHTVSKAHILKCFNAALCKQQKTGAMRSIRVSRDNTATATLGGAIKGKRKTYVSKKAAVAAIRRRYESK